MDEYVVRISIPDTLGDDAHTLLGLLQTLGVMSMSASTGMTIDVKAPKGVSAKKSREWAFRNAENINKIANKFSAIAIPKY